MSRDCATALQPGQQTETPSQNTRITHTDTHTLTHSLTYLVVLKARSLKWILEATEQHSSWKLQGKGPFFCFFQLLKVTCISCLVALFSVFKASSSLICLCSRSHILLFSYSLFLSPIPPSTPSSAVLSSHHISSL